MFTRDELMDAVWRYPFYSDTATVTVHVRRVRQKIEADPLHPPTWSRSGASATGSSRDARRSLSAACWRWRVGRAALARVMAGRSAATATCPRDGAARSARGPRLLRLVHLAARAAARQLRLQYVVSVAGVACFALLALL